MDKPSKKLFRCAIYTRKSTDHNLDLEFNSLDAQREACEAYIKSQAHEGWRPIPDRYDDGAFSGASLERPALQQLLADVRDGKIDIIVVYKVDRLTRSLADFAKLVELFDQHSVSFVSVTQSFNTTSSMGRLTLNVLLSFAQFEREVIGERVRDKIAASKRKGIWVGGPIPLGYTSINKKLEVVPEEAETVRLIFRRYLELGSIGTLVQDLDRRGIRTKHQVGAKGKTRGGIRFGVGSLAYLLRNRFYIGEVVFQGGVHPGEHEPILDKAVFDAVQSKLAAGATARQLRLRGSAAILTGRIVDDRGNRMTPTHTNKRGARYRYYVSHAVLQKRKEEAGSVSRVPAPEIEAIVQRAVRAHLNKNTGIVPAEMNGRELVERYVRGVIVWPEVVEVQVKARSGDQDAKNIQPGLADPSASHSEDAAPVGLRVPWSVARVPSTKGIIHAPEEARTISPATRDALLMAIAKARSWIDDLVEGRAASFAEIAKGEEKVERHVRFLASLAFVSPRIVSGTIERSAPAEVTVTSLVKAMAYSWTEQIAALDW
jgi:DNA invertase Pin-like site-specific DNA recombinase